jgi:hypothetical protein
MSRICAAGTVSPSRYSCAKFAALQLNQRRPLPHRARCVDRAGIQDGFARHILVCIQQALIAARSVFEVHIQR